MSHRDLTVPVRHMRDHALEAIQMLEGRTREDFGSDRQLSLALTRLMEIVGEAANRVSSDTKDRLTSVPWNAVIGFRNRLIHASTMSTTTFCGTP